MPAGKQGGRLVPCWRSKKHGHHPEYELCPYCPPPRAPSERPAEDLEVSGFDPWGWLEDAYP